MGSEGSWSLTACSALTNSPTGCVGRSVVRITIIFPSPRRSLDRALGTCGSSWRSFLRSSSGFLCVCALLLYGLGFQHLHLLDKGVRWQRFPRRQSRPQQRFLQGLQFLIRE